MTLIKSISGIRGTIGGPTGDTLNPLDIVRFVTAYAAHVGADSGRALSRPCIVVGRDARLSGEMVRSVVCGTLMGCGFDVIDIGMATTPTTELAVVSHGAAGGIIITASHNPRQWNALKLLNAAGEFLDKTAAAHVLALADEGSFRYADVDHIGSYSTDGSSAQQHIDKVLALQLVDVEAIRRARFRVCLDAINSVGALILPELLNRLGVQCEVINGSADGNFAHNPEPLEKNLGEIMGKVGAGGFDLGIVVDPDVDRLAFICEDGTMFGEEYTLVACADYVLSCASGNTDCATVEAGSGRARLCTVSNLSSSRALRDVTELHGGTYAAAAVGEVNVVEKMKEVGAVIGGEGNGGVIYPACHYGRDALVGIALFLSYMARKGCKASQLRAALPAYSIAKNRIDLTPTTDIDAILTRVKAMYAHEKITYIDGVRIDFADSWVHLRKSNTEPIIRVYSEAPTLAEAERVAATVTSVVRQMM